jgi:CPA1 family monovalent cation:H+ antiporter
MQRECPSESRVRSRNAAFPQRNVLIFLTFCVILFTLVAQGLSLPALIRKLGLAASDGANREEREARRKMIAAAIKKIRDMRATEVPEADEPLADLLHHYQQRYEAADDGSAEKALDAANYEVYGRL